MIRLCHIKQMDRLDTNQQKELKAHIHGSRKALEFLKSILEEKLGELETQEISKKNYESPSFPYLIADIHGSKRVVKEFIHLLSEVDQTND